MLSDHLTEVLHVARKHAPFVPKDGARLFERLTPMGNWQSFQPVTIESHERRYDRNPMPGFCESQQGVRGPALDRDIWLQAGEMAGRVEGFAKREARVQRQQWIGSEAAKFDRAAVFKLECDVTGSPKRKRGYRKSPKVVVTGRDDVIQVDPKIGLAALDLGKNLKTRSFDRFHLHIGIALGVPVQERREHAVDQVRRGGYPQEASIAAAELLSLVCQ